MAKFKVKSEAALKKMSVKQLEDYQAKFKANKAKSSKKDGLVKSLSKLKK